MACNGHLDFGLGTRDAGAGGAGARDARADAAGGRGVPGAASGGAAGGGAGAAGGGAGTSPAGCAADVDCRLASLHCDVTGDRTCVECVSDDHCARSGASATGGLHCDTKLRRCVACLTPAQCPAAQTCLGGRCVPTCVDDSTPTTCAAGTKCESGTCSACEPDEVNPCAASPTTRYCLTSPRVCVACRTDGDCAGGTRCDPVRKACVACIAAADCPASTPLCDVTTGSCF